ncbi:MAG: NADH-quinone oxidoreductase subunit H, partial [Verrucomicrobiales bacterium]
FFMGEYVAMLLMCCLIVTLFLGGWHFPFITNPEDHSIFAGLLSVVVFLTKVTSLLFVFVWIRWTLPRFRYDQLMKLGWIVFFELALLNIFITAGILILTRS